MAETTVGDVIDPERDSVRVHAERSRPTADVPDVSRERFAGKAWVSGDLDTQSFEAATVAIERLCQVCFTEAPGGRTKVCGGERRHRRDRAVLSRAKTVGTVSPHRSRRF